jgi:eukaryotic translation initiation factor 2C
MSQPRGRGRGAAGAGAPRGGPPYRTGDRGGPRGGTIYNTGQLVKLDPNVSAPTELIQRLRTSHSGPERPSRPGYGTVGRVVALRANFFALESMPEVLYEYIVQIMPEPKSQKPRVKRRVLALFEQTSDLRPFVNDIAHDGAQRLVASKPLPEPLRGTVIFYEEGDPRPPRDADKYTVEVSFFKELPTEPLKR